MIVVVFDLETSYEHSQLSKNVRINDGTEKDSSRADEQLLSVSGTTVVTCCENDCCMKANSILRNSTSMVREVPVGTVAVEKR